jgi:hypothetical protein
MSAFTLLEQITEKTIALPRNTLKNTLIVCQAILHAGTVNLNKAKNSLPHVRGSGSASAHADYKLLTRYFGQGKLKSGEDRQRYECTLPIKRNRNLVEKDVFLQTSKSRKDAHQ